MRAFNHVVIGEAPAETSTHAREVNGDVPFTDAERFRDLAETTLRRLARHPHFELAVLVMRSTVLRLQRRVRDEWIGVVGLDNLRRASQRGFDVTVLAKGTRGRLLRQFLGAARESFA